MKMLQTFKTTSWVDVQEAKKNDETIKLLAWPCNQLTSLYIYAKTVEMIHDDEHNCKASI